MSPATTQEKLQFKGAKGSKKSNFTLDYGSVKSAALTLRAVNHKLRKQIVKLLDEHNKLPVTEIYQKLRLEQSVASQHLAILRNAGIVKTEKEGKFIYYSLNYDRLAELSDIVETLAQQHK